LTFSLLQAVAVAVTVTLHPMVTGAVVLVVFYIKLLPTPFPQGLTLLPLAQVVQVVRLYPAVLVRMVITPYLERLLPLLVVGAVVQILLPLAPAALAVGHPALEHMVELALVVQVLLDKVTTVVAH
jgi:hypothetical protein